LGVVQGSAGAATQGAGTSAEAEKIAPSSTDVVGASPSSTAAGEARRSGITGT